ncbi:MAG: tetratricopeptide repeat protein, partial [Prevotella sp.]|nr:tetratricopeptide repeat protein [Prevotella sp.]
LTAIGALFLCVISVAQTQQGVVKTRGRMVNGKHVPGKGLPGTVVSIKGRTAIGVKNNNGTFSFPVNGKQFMVQTVKKSGYTLVDADAAPKTYMHSANMLYLVMETPEQVTQDKLTSEKKIRRTLQRQLQEREDEIEALKAANKISQQEYQKALLKLYADQENNDKLISDMAKRYSELDYDQMDEFYRHVSNFIEQGELTKADSMLRSRGDVGSQIEAQLQKGATIQKKKEELQKAEVVHKHDIEELANRCYSYFESFKIQHQNDSAAKYIEWRAMLDTTNVKWQNDAGQFIQDYQARYNDALKYYETGLRQSITQFGEMDEWAAIFYNNIGGVYDSLGDYTKALEYYQKALGILEKVFGTEHPPVATLYNNIGIVYYSTGDYTKALENHQKALGMKEKVFGTEHPDVALSYNSIGGVYDSLGDYPKALEYYHKALGIWGKVFGAEHPNVATSYNNIGTVYYSIGDYTKALEYYHKALGISEKIFGTEHPDIATSYNNIGTMYYSIGDYPKALEYYHKALGILEKIFGTEHPNVATSYNNIGLVYYSQGDYPKALEYYQKALGIREKVFGTEHPNVATSYGNIGDVYYSQGDYTKALEYFNKSLTLYEKILGAEHSNTIMVREHIKHINSLMILSDNEKMHEYIFIAKTVDGDTPAKQQGMSGEYIMLEFADWNIKSTESLFDKNKEMRNHPKTIIVMKGEDISKYDFGDKIGVQLDLKYVGKEEKNRIIKKYESWKKAQKH